MRVIRFDNGNTVNIVDYTTDKTDIREIAAEFGRANDTLELYNDAGALVARAIWPIGSKCYKYSYDGNLDANPNFCKYIY